MKKKEQKQYENQVIKLCEKVHMYFGMYYISEWGTFCYPNHIALIPKPVISAILDFIVAEAVKANLKIWSLAFSINGNK
jgi:hypothetical protein